MHNLKVFALYPDQFIFLYQIGLGPENLVLARGSASHSGIKCFGIKDTGITCSSNNLVHLSWLTVSYGK